MGSKDDNLATPTHERLKSMMTVKAAAERITAQRTSIAAYERRRPVSMDTARSMIEGWPEAPKMTAGPVLEHYGPPDEATPSRLLWSRTGPWSRMEITADQVVHNFPTPHVDYFTQYVRYPVPPERAADLVA